METTAPTQTEKTLDHESLLLASFILTDVKQTLKGIHVIVAELLRYVTLGLSITNCLMTWLAPAAAEQ